MANEITVSCALSAFKPSVMSTAFIRAVNGLPFSMAGKNISYGTLVVGTAPTAVPLGQVSLPHWSFWCNLDTNNFCTLRNTFGQIDFATLYPGEPALIPLNTACVPFAVASVASILLEYLIVSL